ncbi:MAG: hypothetical protein FWD78_06440 [Treponema sp.]|nr:hypothetical protein [Treponema sp.]
MADYIYCPPLVLNASDKPVYAMPPSNWMAYYVKKDISPEKQDAVFRILDWGNSERGFTAMQVGLLGDHYSAYDINNRVVTRTADQIEAFRKVSSGNFAFANAYRDLPAIQGGSTPENTAKWQAETKIADAATVKCYFGFTKMLDQIGVQFPDINSDLSSLEVRYITGEIPYETLDAYIKNTYAPAVAPISAEFAAYMVKNPARYVNR